jgi:hypothetical protein
MNKASKALYRSLLKWTRKKEIKNSVFLLHCKKLKLSEELTSLLPSNQTEFQTSTEISDVIKECFRRNAFNRNTLDCGFEAIRVLNKETPRIKALYENHLVNSNEMFFKYAKFRIGEVVEVTELKIRGIVMGWKVTPADGAQLVSILPDFHDGPFDRMGRKSTVTFLQDELSPVSDSLLHYIYNSRWSEFFYYYDPFIQRYIPRPHLAFSYANDYERILAAQSTFLSEKIDVSASSLMNQRLSSKSLEKFFSTAIIISKEEISIFSEVNSNLLKLTKKLTESLFMNFPTLMPILMTEYTKKKNRKKVDLTAKGRRSDEPVVENTIIWNILSEILEKVLSIQITCQSTGGYWNRFLQEYPELKTEQNDSNLFLLTPRTAANQLNNSFLEKYLEEREFTYHLFALFTQLHEKVEELIKQRFQGIHPFYQFYHDYNQLLQNKKGKGAAELINTKTNTEVEKNEKTDQKTEKEILREIKRFIQELNDPPSSSSSSSSFSPKFSVGQVVKRKDRRSSHYTGVIVSRERYPSPLQIASADVGFQPLYEVLPHINEDTRDSGLIGLSSLIKNSPDGKNKIRSLVPSIISMGKGALIEEDEDYLSEDSLELVSDSKQIESFYHPSFHHYFIGYEKKTKSFIPSDKLKYSFPAKEYEIPKDYPNTSIRTDYMNRFKEGQREENILQEIQIHEKIDSVLLQFHRENLGFLQRILQGGLSGPSSQTNPETASNPISSAPSFGKPLPTLQYAHLSCLLKSAHHLHSASFIDHFLWLVWQAHSNPLVSICLRLSQMYMTRNDLNKNREILLFMLKYVDEDNYEALHRMALTSFFQAHGDEVVLKTSFDYGQQALKEFPGFYVVYEGLGSVKEKQGK